MQRKKRKRQMPCQGCGGPFHAMVVEHRKEKRACKTCYMRVLRGGRLARTSKVQMKERNAMKQAAKAARRAGISVSEIARRLRISPRTAARWVSR